MKTTQNLIQKRANFALTPLFVSAFFLVLILYQINLIRSFPIKSAV